MWFRRLQEVNSFLRQLPPPIALAVQALLLLSILRHQERPPLRTVRQEVQHLQDSHGFLLITDNQ